jgi:hypothetical protein
MEISTGEKMDAFIFTNLGYDPKEISHRYISAQMMQEHLSMSVSQLASHVSAHAFKG